MIFFFLVKTGYLIMQTERNIFKKRLSYYILLVKSIFKRFIIYTLITITISFILILRSKEQNRAISLLMISLKRGGEVFSGH